LLGFVALYFSVDWKPRMHSCDKFPISTVICKRIRLPHLHEIIGLPVIVYPDA